jgi:hydroxyacylglutathione hydrolase
LEIVSFTLGPVFTNTYMIADPDSGQAVVIDPAWNGAEILAQAKRRDWNIAQIWITHAHFDHIGGVSELVTEMDGPVQVALHPDDRTLWDVKGGAELFGYDLPANPPITKELSHGMQLLVGATSFTVLHTPGHTPGHCIFFSKGEEICFCGDLIFHDSVGRTDLPGGDQAALVKSIRDLVFSMPDSTRLLSGHGSETTVGREKRHNPFVGRSSE